MLDLLLYLFCGFAVGSLNSVAGGGAFILFPVLLGQGLSPVLANTTMSMVVLPGTASSVFGYREHLSKLKPVYYLLVIPSAIGSLIGAMTLIDGSAGSFMRVVPIFMALASVLLLLQPFLHKTLYKKRVLSRHHFIAVSSLGVAFLLLAAYGGYFGAGLGIILLALLGLMPIKDIQQVNGLKNLAALSIGAVDCTYFALHHMLDWHILPMFMVGNLLGGYFASIYGRKLPAATLRFVMVLIAVGVTIYTFYKFYA